MRTKAPRLALPLLIACLAGCGLQNLVPVNPLVHFQAYPNPNFPASDFQQALAGWKAGQSVNWTVTYKSSNTATAGFSVASQGPATLPTGASFTPTRSELSALADALVSSNIFALYDGYYGAYLQASGTGGPDVT